MSARAGRRARGFSLIEFMVAIVLGSILIGGAIGVYLGSRRSYTEVEQVAALAENARFSLSVLQESLRHVGFFGAAGPPLGVDPTGVSDDPWALDASVVPGSTPCIDEGEPYRLDPYFFGEQATSGASFGCVDDALAGTDVLVIKHLAPDPSYDADPNQPAAARDGVISFPAALLADEVYAVANSQLGILFLGGAAAPSVGPGAVYANGVAYPYRFNIYYVRDTGGVPALARKVLEWDAAAGAMVVATQDLVEGVENLQFLYGRDTDLDGEADVFTNQTGVTDWSEVLVVRAFLLVQSATEDPGFVNDRSYQLGDVTVAATNDNRRRLLVRTEVTLRNPRLRQRGGA